jgi:protein-S-isoprenylcysteine O-methyltransferase Ste14
MTMSSSPLELRIPPPAVAIGVATLMWVASNLTDPLPIPAGPRLIGALAIAALGLVLAIVAIVTFVRAGTTVNPTKPDATTVLVTHGVFQYSRNPMYVSLLLYLVAWAVYLASWISALGWPLFVLYMNRFQVVPEERSLAKRFPGEFEAYRRAVRRWL